MFTSGLRGLGMAQPPQVMVPVPQPNGTTTQMPTAETSLANAAYQDAQGYTEFTTANNSPQYQSPAAYTANMIEYAKELCYNSWAPYTCVGFDPVAMGTKYANIVFAALKSTPYGSTNVYDYWVSHPVAITPGYTPPIIQSPYNPASVPGSSVLPPPPNTLNNVAPGTVSVTPAPGTSVLNPPVQNWFPLNPTQIANGTTGEPTIFPNLSGATTWLQDNWKLVAAGLAAVVILPSLLGGKR